MYSQIPLEVLGLIGPLLSWIESGSDTGMLKSRFVENPYQKRSKFFRGNEMAVIASQERNWLVNELPTYSLDSVDEVIAFARREKVTNFEQASWFPENLNLAPPAKYDLYQVFEKLAQRYFRWHGGVVSVYEGRMIELHELAFRLPLSFLVRHTHAKAIAASEKTFDEVLKLPESIRMLPSSAQSMTTIVQKGLSEGHLHLNAIHAAEKAWADHLLKPLNFKPRRFQLIEWKLLKLGRAASKVLALATALCRGNGIPDPKAVRTIFESFDAMYFSNDLHSLETFGKKFQIALDSQIVTTMERSFLAQADSWFFKPRTKEKPRSLRQDQESSPTLGLLHWFGPWGTIQKEFRGKIPPSIYGTLRSAADREFCMANLHLAAHVELVRYHGKNRNNSGTVSNGDSNVLKGRASSTLAGAFLQKAMFRYLICQSHFWHSAVQQGTTPGLQQFKMFYDSNQRWPIEATNHQNARSVFRQAQKWPGLNALEGRVSPPTNSGKEFNPWLRAFASGISHQKIKKFGLVVHFIKNKVAIASQRGKGGHRARFAQLRAEYRKQAFQLFRILECPNLVNPFIVGIDAANLELEVPPEVFAPIFQFLRNRPIGLRNSDSVTLDDRLNGDFIRDLVSRRRLGMTYHVGEDFRHLGSGLRAIDEVLEFLLPSPGDRIGHCIALGIDPEIWLKQVGFQTLVSKQEWLDTLVWLYHFLGASDDLLGRLGIEGTIEKLGREIYPFKSKSMEPNSKYHSKFEPSIASPYSLKNAWWLRQLDPEFLELDEEKGSIVFKPLPGDDTASFRWNRISKQMVDRVKRNVGFNPPIDLLARYWYSEWSRSAGECLELIDMEGQKTLWIDLCRKVQARLQEKIIEKQVTIEINPSANRVIGPFSTYFEHHIFNLTFDKNNKHNRRIRVTVNTDNPGTANTSLAHEYYLLGETLIARGVPEPEVVDWLEWLRQNGEEASFLNHFPTSDDPRMEEIIRTIKKHPWPLKELNDPRVCLAELWRHWPKHRKDLFDNEAHSKKSRKAQSD